MTMIKMTKSVIIWTAHKCCGIDVKINSFWDHRTWIMDKCNAVFLCLRDIDYCLNRVTTNYNRIFDPMKRQETNKSHNATFDSNMELYWTMLTERLNESPNSNASNRQTATAKWTQSISYYTKKNVRKENGKEIVCTISFHFHVVNVRSGAILSTAIYKCAITESFNSRSSPHVLAVGWLVASDEFGIDSWSSLMSFNRK